MNDRDIIDGIIHQDNEAYKKLYEEYYPMVEKYVLQNSGTSADAKDIFQDTVIILHDKALHKTLAITASVKTYIYSIARNLWLKKLREKKTKEIIDLDETEESIEQRIIDVEDKQGILQKLSKALHKMTGHCKMLLYSMFFRKKSLAAIAEEHNYKNIHTAQNQKYKCLEQARKEFKK